MSVNLIKFVHLLTHSSNYYSQNLRQTVLFIHIAAEYNLPYVGHFAGGVIKALNKTDKALPCWSLHFRESDR